MINSSIAEILNHYGKIFCDTSFFYAVLDPNDFHHGRARVLLNACEDQNIILITTWDVVSETITLLRYRLGYRAAIDFLNEVKPYLTLELVDQSVREEAEIVFRKFGKDKELSFCDCISFVLVSGVLQQIPCLAFDEDFERLGLLVLDEPL
jgi:predicted nucleic acid-binding protein